MEIDSNFHSNGHCIETKIDWTGYSRYEKYELEIIIAFTALVFLAGVYGLSQLGIIIFPESVNVECMLYHIGTTNQQSQNNKITYNTPQKICDIEVLKVGNSPRAYRYSYEIQEKYDKPHGFAQYTCDDNRLDFSLIINNKTMNLICPDGTIAKYYDRFE